jgi:hypothetical protein
MMQVRIADTFTSSLAPANRRGAKGRQDNRLRLAAEPGEYGQSFHKLDKARDKSFWSVR